MPPSDLELSITGHLSATDEEIWAVGGEVAIETGKSLYGRGDVLASNCQTLMLAVNAAPLPSNPNHAHIGGWPPDKPAQKNIAQQIAAKAK